MRFLWQTYEIRAFWLKSIATKHLTANTLLSPNSPLSLLFSTTYPISVGSGPLLGVHILRYLIERIGLQVLWAQWVFLWITVGDALNYFQLFSL